MTASSPTLLPSCPSYCDGRHREGEAGWEVTATGDLIRDHSGGHWDPIASVDSPMQRVEMWVTVEEVLGAGAPNPATVYIIADDGANLTPAQARTFAAQLLAAANMAEHG